MTFESPLRNALRQTIDTTLAHAKQSSRSLAEYEIEVRFGAVYWRNEMKFAASTLTKNEYIPSLGGFDIGEKHFKTHVGDVLFYQSFQQFATEMRHLCHTITPVETSHVALDDTLRITTYGDGKMHVIEKKRLMANSDFLGAKENPKSAFAPRAIRLVANHELPVETSTTDQSNYYTYVMESEPRFRERRSVYLYDTTALATHQRDGRWVHPSKINECDAQMAPRSPWRIDFTRVTHPVGEELQIELELDLAYGWQMTCEEIDRFGYTNGTVKEYFEYRVARTLAECIYRVQASFDPQTPATWLYNF